MLCQMKRNSIREIAEAFDKLKLNGLGQSCSLSALEPALRFWTGLMCNEKSSAQMASNYGRL